MDLDALSARIEAKRKRNKALLAPIRKGSFILCINSGDCKWAIYQAQVPGSDFHCLEREVVFTGEPWHGLPDNLKPVRYWSCDYKIESNRYDFDINAISLPSVRAVYQTEAEVLQVAEQLRAEEEAYVEATKAHRDRFAVFGKLVANV